MVAVAERPLIKGGVVRKLKTADRAQLLDLYDQTHQLSNEAIRRAVVEDNRIDILAGVVLGYDVKPLHLAMLRFQFLYQDTLQLVFRGAGKSSMCTVVKSIHYLIKNRNFRILLASKTKDNVKAFLTEIKGHLVNNERLTEIFGPFYDPRRTEKWDETEIVVLGRTRSMKEASITCVGVESAVVSKHYDALLPDDLVDEDNSRTPGGRLRTNTWYYQTLLPTLEPPAADVPHRGENHKSGTRYHYLDLWGHMIENELKDPKQWQRIRALDDDGRSSWPEKYPSKHFRKLKLTMGTILFNAQYQNDTDAMKGEIFQYDDCQQIDESEYPDIKSLKIFGAADLAITEKEANDKFAITMLGILGKLGSDNTTVYVLDYFEGHLRFSQQTKKIREMYEKWDPISFGIESVAYQAAQYQHLKDLWPLMRVIPINTDKDKVTRAWKLSGVFEAKRVFFMKNKFGPLIDQLVLFPSFKYKDGFDSFDLAYTTSKRRRRRRARQEPGVI